MALPPIVVQLSNEAATHSLGLQLGQRLPAGTVLLLEGNLGSGKTTLVKGLGQGLGIEETIDSPTFTLINEYQGGRVPLYHIDLYRLETPQAVRGLRLESYWDGIEAEPGIMAIEWSERLPYRPEAPLTLALDYSGQGRRAVLTPAIATQAKLLEALFPNAVLVDEV